MVTTSSGRTSPTTRYLLEMGVATAAYVAVVIGSSAVVNAHPDAPWRWVVAVTPVVPAVAMVVAVLRHARRVDELERRIQFEAITLAALLTGLVTFTWGFLELAGAPALPTIWVFPLLVGFWGVGVGVAKVRYR